jgi:PhnB protein
VTQLAFITYLSFDGDCDKAFAFYARATGGKIAARLTYGESPMACGPMDAKMKRRLAHICLETRDGILMGGDAPPGMHRAAQGFNVNFTAKTPAAARRAFDALMKGGKVGMPMQETFFARAFGMGTDRFGTPWMVICPKPKPKKKGKAA